MDERLPPGFERRFPRLPGVLNPVMVDVLAPQIAVGDECDHGKRIDNRGVTFHLVGPADRSHERTKDIHRHREPDTAPNVRETYVPIENETPETAVISIDPTSATAAMRSHRSISYRSEMRTSRTMSVTPRSTAKPESVRWTHVNLPLGSTSAISAASGEMLKATVAAMMAQPPK